MRASSTRLVAAALALLGAAGSATAQDKDARLREALARAQRTITTLQQEKGALEREKGVLAAKLEDANREAQALKADIALSRRRAAAADKELPPLRSANDDLRKRLEAAEKRITELNTARALEQKKAADEITRLEGERTAVESRFERESAALQACVATNAKLQALTRELAERYEMEARARADPVLGLRLVEIENEIQNYRDRADDLRVDAIRRR